MVNYIKNYQKLMLILKKKNFKDLIRINNLLLNKRINNSIKKDKYRIFKCEKKIIKLYFYEIKNY